jgi:serine/threonine-protein kinase
LLGQVIDNRYKVLEQVGRGGMGVVFKARHVALGSMVAVKVLLRPQSDRDRDDMLREAQLASKALHPNVIQVMDVGLLPDGRPYLVMEFLEGQTLGQIQRQGPLPPLRACRLLAQVARGMQAIHDKGIVHRELYNIDRSGLLSTPKTGQRRRKPHADLQYRPKPHIPSTERRR